MIRVWSVIFLEKLLSSAPILIDSPAISLVRLPSTLAISPRTLTNSAATAVNWASTWSNFAVIDVASALRSSLVATWSQENGGSESMSLWATSSPSASIKLLRSPKRSCSPAAMARSLR